MSAKMIWRYPCFSIIIIITIIIIIIIIIGSEHSLAANTIYLKLH